MKTVLILIAVPLLYLFSVAPLRAYVCKPKFVSVTSRIPPAWLFSKRPPDWITTYSKPYFWVVKNTPAAKPLEAYQTWIFELTR